MMVAMFYWLTRLRLDGTTFQTEVLTQKRTLDMVSPTQNTFIITIFTAMLMKNLEQKEASLELILAASYQEVNSVMKADGDHSIATTQFKRTYLNKYLTKY